MHVPDAAAGKDLVRYTSLPAETGPTWAPDQLSLEAFLGGALDAEP